MNIQNTIMHNTQVFETYIFGWSTMGIFYLESMKYCFISQQLENILTRWNIEVMTDKCNVAVIGVCMQMIKSSR